MHGHLKLTGEVRRGVITVANHETREYLQNKIQWRAGELADIRKLGNSDVAALTFVGKVVPQFVHYNSEVTLVRAYKRTILACGRCGSVRHRADTCPCSDDKCGLCDHAVPTADGVKAPHECTPSCAVCGQAHATNSRDCTGKFRQLKLPSHKARRPKPRPPKKSLSHPTPEANGGVPRGAHGSDPKRLSPPPPSATSAHGKKTAGKDTRHFRALETDGAAGARASTPQHGKQLGEQLGWACLLLPPSPSSTRNTRNRSTPQNSDAMESDAELSPALVATISAMEERLTSKMGSMIGTTMDQILTKVMTAVPAMISIHIQDNLRLVHQLGPVKDVSLSFKIQLLNNESENEDNYPAHSVITPLVAQRAGSGAAIPSSSPLQNFNHGETPYSKAFPHLQFGNFKINNTMELSQDWAPHLQTTRRSNRIQRLVFADPPLHVLNVYYSPKLKRVTFADLFSRALRVAGRDPLLIVGDFNAPSQLWGYRERSCADPVAASSATGDARNITESLKLEFPSSPRERPSTRPNSPTPTGWIDATRPRDKCLAATHGATFEPSSTQPKHELKHKNICREPCTLSLATRLNWHTNSETSICAQPKTPVDLHTLMQAERTRNGINRSSSMICGRPLPK
ncbi:hypothetical protein HPB49_016183 [Dermacentor silvarum]|uniref:Uncharacterized protein n=1 Tax=Dermacentor silvarum TaxID=543639 RepID=A0ACB8E1F1_DERSI|nr:hypothetical protein HPB49_016183 [Dermacentor silvarum]